MISTNIRPLVRECEDLGFVFTVISDEVKIHAPKGVATPELLARLKESKAEIEAFIKKAYYQNFTQSIYAAAKEKTKNFESPNARALRKYIWDFDHAYKVDEVKAWVKENGQAVLGLLEQLEIIPPILEGQALQDRVKSLFGEAA